MYQTLIAITFILIFAHMYKMYDIVYYRIYTVILYYIDQLWSNTFKHWINKFMGKYNLLKLSLIKIIDNLLKTK